MDYLFMFKILYNFKQRGKVNIVNDYMNEMERASKYIIPKKSKKISMSDIID